MMYKVLWLQFCLKMTHRSSKAVFICVSTEENNHKLFVNIVTCYGTGDAIQIINSFYLQLH
jgi:hypothetical protein